MERIKCICVMRYLFQALSVFEDRLLQEYGISLNEAMVLCSIGQEHIAARTIADRTGLSQSHTSKVIRAAEDKKLLVRCLGENDKRQMYFYLTNEAKDILQRIKTKGVEIPPMLQPLFDLH